MHSRLLNKVYVHGMNAVFGLKIQVSVGDTVVTGLAVSLTLCAPLEWHSARSVYRGGSKGMYRLLHAIYSHAIAPQFHMQLVVAWNSPRDNYCPTGNCAVLCKGKFA